MGDGKLRRLPRHPERRDLLLALISLRLQRRYPYAENELNDVLREVLGQMGSWVDHVTCRRYLVDLGFVKRDRAGRRYFVNFAKLASVLSDEVIESDDDPIELALAKRE
jgi:hypothetical protein